MRNGCDTISMLISRERSLSLASAESAHPRDIIPHDPTLNSVPVDAAVDPTNGTSLVTTTYSM
jgi:hypothetical protein